MPKTKYTELDYKIVIDLFLTMEENSAVNIRKITGYGRTYINNCIDKHFENAMQDKKIVEQIW